MWLCVQFLSSEFSYDTFLPLVLTHSIVCKSS